MLLFAHIGLALLIAHPFKRINLLFLALGSILPDIVDKPLGLIIYGTPMMGRIFAHTLLFLLLLFALAFLWRDWRVGSLAFGVLIHLLLDGIWGTPQVLFWPLLGPFPPVEHLDPLGYVEMLLQGLKNPQILLPECLGLAWILYLAATANPPLASRVRGLRAR